MSWFWTIILLINFTFSSFSEAKYDNNPPSAVVVGTVLCDLCFQQDFSLASHFIEGATVALECKNTNFRQEVKTDKNGEFQINLPFPISKHVNKVKDCSVKLLSSNEPYCSIAATTMPSTLQLKSRKQGSYIFSAGYFTFQPLKQSHLCDQNPTIKNFNSQENRFSPIPNSINNPIFSPTIQDPPCDHPESGRFLSSLPQTKIPLLPSKPKNELNPTQNSVDQIFFPFPNPQNPFNPFLPPNPFQPPRSIIPPLFSSPPPSLFPPLFRTPSLPPFFRLPPIPGLVPSPPAPAPPLFRLPPIPGLVPSPPPPSPRFSLPIPKISLPPIPGFSSPRSPPPPAN